MQHSYSYLRRLLLLLSLVSCGQLAHAASYYWVPAGSPATGTGAWNDLSHWAASSGGSGGAYSQVPQSTDDVFFDANSFNAASQRVSLIFSGSTSGSSVPVCHNMTWSGNVRSAGFINNNTLEI
ncbi:MAG: hypothetical protein EOO60_05770, partial [Hymenobacter sp.]